MPDKKYQVANPRAIPEGIRIMVTTDKEFYEGDAISAEDVGGPKNFAGLVEKGLVVEVKERRTRGKNEPAEPAEPEVTAAELEVNDAS